MEEWYLGYLTQGTEGGALDYRGINIERHYDQHADVPSVYSGGWYDSYARATITILRPRTKGVSLLN